MVPARPGWGFKITLLHVKLETLRRYASALDCELVVEIRESRRKTKKQSHLP
jgi:hypothetical protein